MLGIPLNVGIIVTSAASKPFRRGTPKGQITGAALGFPLQGTGQHLTGLLENTSGLADAA